MLKTFASNAAPVGLNPKLSGKESLIPIKNGCEASATGPPVARPSIRRPAKVESLRGPQCGLEGHDVLYLRRRRNRTLRMPGGGIYRLVSQIS